MTRNYLDDFLRKKEICKFLTKCAVLEIADIELTPENLINYEDCGYLTINEGRNERWYVWYVDEKHNIAMDIWTRKLLTEEEIDEYLM